jgi:hypothetical protein
MSRFVDSIIAYRILRMLVTPFDQTDAFRLGIVDEKGKELKKMKDLNSVDEKDAYSILHRMIFRIKRIIEKIPTENKKLASFAAALSLIKEHYHTTNEPVDLEWQYMSLLETDLLEEDVKQTNQFFNKNLMLPFKLFIEDVPANNAAATPGIDGFTPETIGVKKKKKPLVITRNKGIINV